MQIEAMTRLDFIPRKVFFKLNLYSILAFNLLMYLGMVIIIVLLVESTNGSILVSRVYRAFIEFFICIGILITSVKLIKTVKKFSNAVPKILIFWLVLGGLTSIYKCVEQIGLYFFDQGSRIDLIVLLFISYNLVDILPSLVFLQTFTVYSNFFSDSQSIPDEDISIMNILDSID